MQEPPPPNPPVGGIKSFSALILDEPSKRDQQISELQEQLTQERDARREDKFIFIAVAFLLLDIVFFTVMPTFGGPIALIVLELLILIPLARRMGIEEIAQICGQVIDRMAGNANGKD